MALIKQVNLYSHAPMKIREHTPNREALAIYDRARELLRTQGFGNVLRIGNYITITQDDSTLTIIRDVDHRAVLSVVHTADIPFVVSFLGGSWCRLLDQSEHRSR